MDSAEITEALNEWEQIQSPPLHMPPTSQSKEWDMVVIRENNNLSSFPPTHHEGLQINEQPNSPSSSSSSPDNGLASNGWRIDSMLHVAYVVGRHLRLLFRVISSKIVQIANKIRYFVVWTRGFWSFLSVTRVIAAVLMSLLHVRVQRWRRRVHEEKKKNGLILLIEEKDQKINKLMLQIAQMNELLSARRRVPVVRIK